MSAHCASCVRGVRGCFLIFVLNQLNMGHPLQPLGLSEDCSTSCTQAVGAGTATANVIKTLHMAPRPASYAQPDLRTPRAASVRRSALQSVQEQDVADGEQSDMDDRDLVSPGCIGCSL